MEAALAALDRFDLTRTPNFEPRRGPVVPSYIAAAHAPLLFMPVRAAPEDGIAAWLAAIDGAGQEALQINFTQKTLRQWKRKHPGHRAFTVLRHPVPRAYRAFQQCIVGTGKGAYLDIRKTLIRVYNVPLAPDGPDESWGAKEQRAAFEAYLAFVKMNLGGQTAVRADATWASQAVAIQGFSEFAMPDAVMREDTLDAELGALAQLLGLEAPAYRPEDHGDTIPLKAIYDAELEAAVREVYQRDYLTFGFGSWGQ